MERRGFELNQQWGAMTEPEQSGNECGRCGHRPGRNENRQGCRTCNGSPYWLASIALATNRGNDILLIVNGTIAYKCAIDVEWISTTFNPDEDMEIAILREAGEGLRDFYEGIGSRVVEYYQNSMNTEFINLVEGCNRGDVIITVGSVHRQSIDTAARRGCTVVTFWSGDDRSYECGGNTMNYVNAETTLPLTLAAWRREE